MYQRLHLQKTRPLYPHPNIYLGLELGVYAAKNSEFSHRVSVVNGYVFKKERIRIRIFSLFSSVSEILKQDLGENPSEITTTPLKSHLIVEKNAGCFKCLYKSTSKWCGANLGAIHKWWPPFFKRGQKSKIVEKSMKRNKKVVRCWYHLWTVP